MYVGLDRHSEASLLAALDDAGIKYDSFRPMPGRIMASGTMVEIAQVAGISGAVATVLVAWIKARASRRVILTIRGNQVVHLEGYSVQQVQDLLPAVNRLSAIDTQPVEQPSGATDDSGRK
jgi:hypothetical protein